MTTERWQQVRTLYFELAELEPEDRTARLESVLRSDPELGEQLKRLLAADEQTDELLASFDDLISQLEFEASAPVDGQPSIPDPHRLVGRAVAHYEVLELLGAGGMGVVYKAIDTRLGRPVALKFLPPQWSLEAVFKERFLLEARAAATLDHNNVCSIYEIGETEEGQLFIAMALYEGETVREKIARGPLDVDEALDIAEQAMSGLEAAHEAGLVHRDIKPANLIVTKSGVLKVLDFGLAKTAEASRTEPGMRLGTPAYMSPEQTRGEEVDEGTDLWSLGVVLYEMLTGRHPFRGGKDSAVIDAIRRADPRPPSQLREDLPPHVEELVLGLLSKDPEARYEGAETLSSRLTGARSLRAGGSEPVEEGSAIWDLRRRSLWQLLGGYAIASWIVLQVAETLGSLIGLPLWFGRYLLAVLLLILPLLLVTGLVQATRRTDAAWEDSKRRRMRRVFSWRHAAVAAAAALLLLAMTTGGYIAMRSLGIGPAGTLIARGRLDDRASVLLADFEAGDSVLAGTATELFRVDLSQSPNVRLVGPTEVAAALERMARSPATTLDAEVALEIAQREGVQAVIEGQIRRAGSSYLLSAQIVAVEDGQILASRRETATDSTRLIEAIDKLSRRLRERIGESLRSIQQSPHLEQVSTSSLEALR
ncbi:MAG: protein kinase [Gemmatimonadales bacterium]